MRVKTKKSSVTLIYSLFLVLAILCLGIDVVGSQDNSTGDTPPVQVGAPCNEPSIYHWSTKTRTPWKPAGLIAVPDGYSPDEWEGTPAFVDSFNQSLSGDRQLSAMSAVLFSLWDQSSQTQARLYGRFERSIRLEKRDIRCIAGTWSIVDGSDSVSINPDTSEWIRIYPEAQDRNGVSTQDVVDNVDRLLSTVNSQVGADTRPHHSYTVSAQ